MERKELERIEFHAVTFDRFLGDELDLEFTCYTSTDLDDENIVREDVDHLLKEGALAAHYLCEFDDGGGSGHIIVMHPETLVDLSYANFVLLHEFGHAKQAEFFGLGAWTKRRIGVEKDEELEFDADEFAFNYCHKVKLFEGLV